MLKNSFLFWEVIFWIFLCINNFDITWKFTVTLNFDFWDAHICFLAKYMHQIPTSKQRFIYFASGYIASEYIASGNIAIEIDALIVERHKTWRMEHIISEEVIMQTFFITLLCVVKANAVIAFRSKYRCTFCLDQQWIPTSQHTIGSR